MAEPLYDARARARPALTGGETVYDLYCGTGTIGLALAAGRGSVWGVEISEESVACAIENAELNGIDERARSSPATSASRSRSCASAPGSPDVVVVDPPRAGLAGKALRAARARSARRGSSTSRATRRRSPATSRCCATSTATSCVRGDAGRHVPAHAAHRVRGAARARGVAEGRERAGHRVRPGRSSRGRCLAPDTVGKGTTSCRNRHAMSAAGEASGFPDAVYARCRRRTSRLLRPRHLRTRPVPGTGQWLDGTVVAEGARGGPRDRRALVSHTLVGSRRAALPDDRGAGGRLLGAVARARTARSRKRGSRASSASDHYVSALGDESRGSLDAWATLAGLASVTERIRLGVLVSPATFRHPSELAKVVATVDHVSGGRVELGLGAGWNEREHVAFGFPFPPLGERLDVLAEQLEIVHRQWTEEELSFEGRHYRLERCRAEPKPLQRPHPPLLMGGSAGPRAWRSRRALPTSTTSSTGRRRSAARLGSGSRRPAARPDASPSRSRS